MTAGVNLAGVDEGRAYIQCDGCQKRHTIRAYGFNKTRTHASLRGWTVGTREDRRDWCPDCAAPEPEGILAREPMPTLFEMGALS